MRVLLNITKGELRKITGDVAYYAELLQSTQDDVEFLALNDERRHPLREFRKVLERATNQRWPTALNRTLFNASRYAYIGDVPAGTNVVFSHILFPLFPRRIELPVVWSSQGISPPRYYDYLGRVRFDDVVAMYQRFANRADANLIWTESCADILRRHCSIRRPIHVIEPIVRLREAKSPPLPRESDFHLLFVGRDPVRKGLYDCLQAVASLGLSRSRLRFDVVSKLPPAMESRLREMDNLVYYSDISNDEVVRLLERADALVLPTYAETYGLVLVEAMARGCALIASDYAPLNELVVAGENGLLVEPGNVSAIATAIHTLVTDSDLRQACQRNNAEKYRRQFHPDVVLPKYVSLLQTVVR